jgi:hypothetical protein
VRTSGATGGFVAAEGAGGAASGAGVVAPGEAGADAGGIEHDASAPRIAATATAQPVIQEVIRSMWLILLEALGALLLLVFIVWWTMFSGRRGGEPPGGQSDERGDG